MLQQCYNATVLQEIRNSKNNKVSLNKTTLQQCYNATVLQELRNSKTIKFIKQSNVATMLQCNSATGIKKQ